MMQNPWVMRPGSMQELRNSNHRIGGVCPVSHHRSGTPLGCRDSSERRCGLPAACPSFVEEVPGDGFISYFRRITKVGPLEVMRWPRQLVGAVEPGGKGVWMPNRHGPARLTVVGRR